MPISTSSARRYAARHDLQLRKQRGGGFYLTDPWVSNVVVCGSGPYGANADLDEIVDFLDAYGK